MMSFALRRPGGLVLLLTLAACRGQSPEAAPPIPRNEQQEQQVTAVPEKRSSEMAGPADRPQPQRNSVQQPPPEPPQPPASQPPPSRKIVPSPYQPPAEVDPIPPDVGNETPGD